MRRGWIYRAVATDASATVLEIGEASTRNWFERVTGGASAQIAQQPADAFGLVVLHASLGGTSTLDAALVAAHRCLAANGVVAMTGYNALRRTSARDVPGAPRATPMRYRAAARRAGFEGVSLYVARPDLDDPDQLVSFASASARRFFRNDVAARTAAGRMRHAALRALLAWLGAASWLEHAIMLVARKC